MTEIRGIVCDIKPKVEYSIILSHKGEKREFPINLSDRRRYYNLVKKTINLYRLESTTVKETEPEIIELKMGYYDKLKDKLNFPDAVWAVVDFSLSYNKKKHGHFPGYLKKRLYSSLRDIWRSSEYTTTALYEERRELDKDESKKKGREAYRILRSDLEYSGGSLDEEILDDEGEGIKRIDLLLDERWSEDSLIEKLDFERRKDSISDPLNKEIFVGYFGYEDKTMTEIGKDLGISRQAVAKRIKEIEKHNIKGIIK